MSSGGDENAGAALTERGRVLNDAGRYADAVPLLRKAIVANPQASAPHRFLAWSLMHLQQLPEALKEAETAIALEPENAYGHRNRALVLLDLQRHREALPAALEAVRLAPQEPVVYHTLARAQLDGQKFVDARATAEKLCELAPEWYFTHETRALVAWHRNDWHTMEASARAALALDPEAGTAMYYLAMAQLNQKRRAEAITSLYEAARLDPRNQQVRRELQRVVEDHTNGALLFTSALLGALVVAPICARLFPSLNPLAMTAVTILLIVGSLVGAVIIQKRRLRRLDPAITQLFEHERQRESDRAARMLGSMLGWGLSVVGTIIGVALWSRAYGSGGPVPWYLPVLTLACVAGIGTSFVAMIRADKQQRR